MEIREPRGAKTLWARGGVSYILSADGYTSCSGLKTTSAIFVLFMNGIAKFIRRAEGRNGDSSKKRILGEHDLFRRLNH